MFASCGKKKYGGNHWVLHRSRRNGEKQIGSRMIREPTWYFQSKLLVSYARKDNMHGKKCQ
jgi:hypothetical protein